MTFLLLRGWWWRRHLRAQTGQLAKPGLLLRCCATRLPAQRVVGGVAISETAPGQPGEPNQRCAAALCAHHPFRPLRRRRPRDDVAHRARRAALGAGQGAGGALPPAGAPRSFFCLFGFLSRPPEARRRRRGGTASVRPRAGSASGRPNGRRHRARYSSSSSSSSSVFVWRFSRHGKCQPSADGGVETVCVLPAPHARSSSPA